MNKEQDREHLVITQSNCSSFFKIFNIGGNHASLIKIVNTYGGAECNGFKYKTNKTVILILK